MKKLIITSLLVSALSVVPAVHATTVECSVSQYGGSTCGVSTSTEETKVEHTYATGAGDNQIVAIIGYMAGTALLATLLYKLTYRTYIFG